MLSVGMPGTTLRLSLSMLQTTKLIAQQTVNRAAAADWRFVKLLFELELLTGDRGELLPRGPDGKPKIPLTLMRRFIASLTKMKLLARKAMNRPPWAMTDTDRLKTPV